MKNLLFLFACFVTFTSCSVSKHVSMGSQPAANPAPYVKTEHQEIVAKEVYLHHGKVFADGKVFRKKFVSGFCDGKDIYLKTGRSDFAKKIVEGDISVYTKTISGVYMSGGSLSSYKKTTFYLQSSTSPALMFMNYKHTRELISDNEPANKFLMAYQHHQKRARGITYIGLGLVALSVGLIAADINDGTNALSFFSFFGGTGIVIWSYVKRTQNWDDLRDAIALHNGVYNE